MVTYNITEDKLFKCMIIITIFFIIRVLYKLYVIFYLFLFFGSLCECFLFIIVRATIITIVFIYFYAWGVGYNMYLLATFVISWIFFWLLLLQLLLDYFVILWEKIYSVRCWNCWPCPPVLIFLSNWYSLDISLG